MARPTKTKKKEKKNVLQGVVHIQSTFNNTIVTSTDAQGIKITVITDKGNFGEMIAEFRVMNGRIISIDIKASNEQYHNNPDYTYDGDVEDYIMNQYELGIKNVIVTGATSTSKAINYMISLVEEYISSIGAGGNK